MAAIIGGNHLGLNLNSSGVLGRTSNGQAHQGSSGERVYVNVATGNLVVQSGDEQLVGRGGMYQSLRTYNSQGKLDTALNWTINGGRRTLRLEGPWGAAGSKIIRQERDGAQAAYDWNAQRQAYVSTDGGGAYRTIVRDGDGYRLSEGNGQEERYDAAGRLASGSDAQGRVTTYAYDHAGRLESVTLPSGERTHYVYAGADLTQVRVESAGGQVSTRVRYGYDGLHRLTQVTVDLTPEDNDIADGRVYATRYAYDGDSERLASIVQDDGSVLRLTYVQSGAQWKVASLTDALGHTTRYDYQGGRTVVTDAMGVSSFYLYDALGQLTQVSTGSGSGAATVRYAYNERGDVISITDGAGRSTRMAYDANGNQLEQQDEQGNLVQRRYDAHNRIIAESILRAGEGASARTTRYVYGAGSQLRFAVSAEGRVTEYRYNAQGDQSSVLRYGQAGATGLFALSGQLAPDEADLVSWAAAQPARHVMRTDMEYDARGQLARQIAYAELDATGQGIAAGASVQHYVYDQSGRLLKTIDGNGGITVYGYDGLGREIVRDEQGKLTQTRYDTTGRTSSTTQANGLTTQRSYDAAGRLLAVAHSGAGQDLGTTRYHYDALGRLVMSEDPLGGRSYVFYDDQGNKAAQLDASGLLTEYRYNGAGQLTRTLAYAARITPTQLPQAGLPNLAALRPSRSEQDRLSWQTYDAAGRLSKEINAHGAVTQLSYDAAGKLIRSARHATLIDITRLGEQVEDSSITVAASAADRTTRHFHDADGLIVATLDAEGYLTEWRYDSAGQSTQVIRHAQAVAADKVNGELNTLQEAVKAGIHTIERSFYNARGQVNGQVDAQGYLTEIIYDANGNVARRIRYATAVGEGQALAELRPGPDAQDRSALMRYDGHNRLVEETDHQGTITRYRYDGMGNLIATTRAAGTPEAASRLAKYDLQGRKIAELSANGAALLTDNMGVEEIERLWQRYGQRYNHDALGRKTGSTDANGNRTSYVYDAAGRLTHTINALGEVVEAHYDAFGQKVDATRYTRRLDGQLLAAGISPAPLAAALAAMRQDAGNSVNTYRYDSLGLLLEQQDAAGLKSHYFYNSFGETVREDRLDGQRRVSHTIERDRKGQITQSVQDAGGLHLVTTRQLDAFGREIESTDARGNTRRTEYDRLGRQIVLTDALGGTVRTSYDAFGRIVRQDEHGRITQYRYDATQRSTTISTPDGVTVATTFNRHGQQQSVTDGRGNVTRLTYDANGNLVTRGQGGHSVSQDYDNANRLIETRDEAGRRTVLTYDAANRVIARTVDPEGLNLTTRTAYDGQGRQVSVTQPDRQVTQFTYDNAGRLTAQIIDPDGLKLSTRHQYDASGQLIRSTQPNGNVTSYAYDNAGRRVEETSDPDGLKLTRRYRYDEAGNLTQSIDAGGHVTRYVYDANNRQVLTINPLGSVQRTVYDGTTGRIAGQVQYARGIDPARIVSHARLADVDALIQQDVADIGQWTRYDTQGCVRQQVDARGAVTSYVYDGNGNVTAKTRHAILLTEPQRKSLIDGRAIEVASHVDDITERSIYDSRNRLRYGMDALGGVMEQRYDAAGNVVQKIAYARPAKANAGDDETVIASKLQPTNEDRHTRYVYDAAGRLRYEINAQGGVSERRYDANGNVTQQTGYARLLAADVLQGQLNEQKIATALQADAADRRSTTLYDAANRAQYSVDAMGYVTHHSYDGAGNLVKVVRYANAAKLARDADGKLQLQALSASAQDRTEHRHYDAAARLRFKIDALGYVEETRYDAAGRIAELVKYKDALTANVGRGDQAEIQQALATTERQVSRYNYDTAGNLVQSTDALGNSETSAYDAYGRRISLTNALGARKTFAYDANGNLIKSIDALDNAESVTYDSFNRKTSVTNQLGAVTRYAYDGLGRLTMITDALGHSERTGYDALGNRSDVTNKLGGTTTYTYDTLGRQVSEILPTQAAGKDGKQQPIVNRIEYDAFGNRTATVEAAGLAEERTTRYTFDAAGRPLNRIGQSTRIYVHGQGWKDTAPTDTTRYDGFGNLIVKTDANGNATRYYYDAANRVIGEVGPTGAYIARQYDAAGNIVVQRSYVDPVGLPAGDDLPAVANDGRCRELRFTYDANGKLLTTTQAQLGYAELDVTTGNLLYKTGDIVTGTAYNAMGQVVANQDAQGNRSYLYYDALGRKILAIDAAGYAVTWKYDANGNAVSQRSYAHALDKSNPWTQSSQVQDLIDRLVTHTRDRLVDFEYDALGRQTAEIRRDAGNAAVEGTGKLTERAGDAITRSAYNANGDLLARTDAIGNVTQWEYDQLGRKSATLLPTATDHTGQAIRQTTRYEYNGLNLLTQETVAGSPSDAARITRHAYDASGRRTSQTLATGDVIRYGYDAQGNTTAEIVDRKQADGSVLREMSSIAYDRANREIRRSSGRADTNNNPVHDNDSVVGLRYDVFGKQIGKITVTGNQQGKTQEFVDYDAAGRIWRSNVDNGITKVYFYDRSGRPTLTLQSQTLDLRSMTLEQIQQEMAKPDSLIATTISVYDERGQMVRTIQPKMSSSRPNASLMAAQGGGYFQGVQLTSGATMVAGAQPYMQRVPAVADSAAVSGALNMSAQTKYQQLVNSRGWMGDSEGETVVQTTATGVAFNLPDFSAAYGAHRVIVRFEAMIFSNDGRVIQPIGVAGGNEKIYTSGGRFEVDFVIPRYRWDFYRAYFGWSMEVFVQPNNGTMVSVGSVNRGQFPRRNAPREFLYAPVIQVEKWRTWGTHIEDFSSHPYNNTTVYGMAGSGTLRLNHQTLGSASKVDLYYRAQGSSGPYSKLPTSVMSGQAGTYVANVAGMTGQYDMLMVAVDKDGKVLRSDRLAVNRANNTVSRTSGVANGAIFEGSAMHLAGLQLGNGKLATSLTYKLNNGTSVRLAARDGIPGLFSIPTGSAAANLELTLTAADGSVDILVGSIDPAKGLSNLQFIKYADSSLVFNNLDKTATRLDIKYREEGAAGWKTKTLSRTPGHTSWTWDTQADGLVPDRSKVYRYEVSFDAYDADGVRTNNGSAVVAAGAMTGGTYTTASIIGAAKPRWMAFNANHPDVTSLSLRYRIKGSNAAFTTTSLSRLPSGIFKLDIFALPGDTEYEFACDVQDADGKMVASSKGYFRSEAQAQATDGSNINWVIGLDNDIRSETQINRSQSYDAFGNIVSETDGRGNTVQFEYNTLGQLTIKRDAATDITLDNGYIVTGHRAETRYYYDAAGNLIGTRDAGGNLATQRWHFGAERAQVAQSWVADGGTKKNGYDVFGNLRTATNEDNWQSTYQYDALNRLVTSERSINTTTKAIDRYEYDIKGQRIAVSNALGHRSITRYDSQGRVTETTSAEGRSVKYAYTYDAAIRSLGDTQTGGWKRVMTDANGRTVIDELDVSGRATKHTDLSGRVYTYRYNYAGLIQSQKSTTGQDIDYSYYGNGYVKNIADRGTGKVATYEYDNNGNRIFEGYMADNGQFAFQQQRVTYDAMNRVVRISDPRYDIVYEYDAQSNRRRMASTYTDGVGGQLAYQEYWYKYDSQSRFTISMGQLTGGKRATRANDASIGIERGQSGDGVALSYTQAGLRASASYAATSQRGAYSERYYYDGRGLLTQTSLDDGSKVLREMDAAGRVTTVKTHNPNGSLLRHTQRTYNRDNQLTQDHDALTNKGTKYELMADGTVAATQTYSADSKDTTLRTTYTYDWWDSAKQASITVQARNSQVDSWKKIWRPGFSHFSYDVNGHSKLAYDEEGKRAFSYWTDQDGQVLKRQELIGGTYDASTGKMNGASKSREHGYYYLDGKRIGDVGNDQTERADYAQELAALRNNDSRRSHERFTPANAADFDANFQPINSEYPAGAPGSYTVRQGDTLQSIARGLWGDASLWYMLAEANGLINQQPGAQLAPNTTITVPNQVTNLHNTASTFKPYNPGRALGDTSPTLPSAPPPPPPPSRGGCGGFGAILTIAVVIAATVLTAGAAAVAMGASGGIMSAGMAALVGGGGLMTAGVAMGAAAIGAAVGSIAGQGFAMITGQQDSFSWKQVGLSALGGAVSAGVGGALNSGTAANMMNKLGDIGQAGRVMVQAGIGNIASQGVMTASGLQHSFDWRGVAASAAAAGVGYAVGKAANAVMNYNPQTNGAGFDWSRQFASNTVTGIASGTAYGMVMGRPANAAQLIAGSAISGAMGATQMEQQLMVAQQAASSREKSAYDELLKATGSEQFSRQYASRYADLLEDPNDVLSFGRATGNPNVRYQVRPSDPEQASAYDKVINMGKSPVEAWLVGKDVAIRQRADGIALEIDTLQKTDPTKAIALREQHHDLVMGLLSRDVYFDNSLSELMSAGWGRVTDVAGLQRANLDPNRMIDKEQGYFAALYRNDRTGQYVYANRGTDEGMDFAHNFAQGAGGVSKQYKLAIENALRIQQSEISTKVEFTGHSLGGGLASAQAIATKIPAVTFNAAGLHPSTVSSDGRDLMRQASSLVRAYYVEGEILSAIQDKSPIALASAATMTSPVIGVATYAVLSQLPPATGLRIAIAPTSAPVMRNSVMVPGDAYRASPVTSLDLHGMSNVLNSMLRRTALTETNQWK